MQYGMIGYYVPLSRYSKTYNGRLLGYAALASQKNDMSLYLMSVYGNPPVEEWFRTEYRKSGKKLDMGKGCVRFRTLGHLPLDLIGQAIALEPADDFIRRYETIRT